MDEWSVAAAMDERGLLHVAQARVSVARSWVSETYLIAQTAPINYNDKIYQVSDRAVTPLLSSSDLFGALLEQIFVRLITTMK